MKKYLIVLLTLSIVLTACTKEEMVKTEKVEKTESKVEQKETPKKEVKEEIPEIITLDFVGVKLENEDSILTYPGIEASRCYEPEYIAISSDSKKAWVGLQENNAIALVDLESGKIEKVKGLGFKDHSIDGNGMDVSDKDKKVNIATWPVKGIRRIRVFC